MLAALPFGLTTWTGFLYIGLRAQRTRWLWAAGAYGAGAVLFITLAVAAPVDARGRVEPGAWQAEVAAVVVAALWIGGLVHALLANHRWLRLRPSATG